MSDNVSCTDMLNKQLMISFWIVFVCLVQHGTSSSTHKHSVTPQPSISSTHEPNTSLAQERMNTRTSHIAVSSTITLSPNSKQTTDSNAVYSDQFISRVLEQHMRYCGSGRVCHRHRPTKCWRCAPCHCDDLCTAYDDCCPDRVFIEPSTPNVTPPTSACLPNIHGSYTDEEKAVRMNNSKRYFVVARCPQETDSAQVVNGCVASPSLPFVTSISDNVTYLNQYCALCNGVSQFKTWNTKIDCRVFRNFQKFNSSEAVLEFALKQDVCWVVYAHSKDIRPRRCYVHENTISSCNVTGKWVQYDEALEQACHSYTTVKEVGSQTYKNVFCFICNTDNPRPYLFRKCKKTHGVVSFSALLDFSSALYEEPESDRKCSQGQLFDGQRNSCRDILCSQGKQLVNRTCVPIFGSAKGLGYEVYFDMVPSEALPLSGSEDLLHNLPAMLNDFFPYALNMLITFHDFVVAFSTTSTHGLCKQSTNRLSIYATFITTGHIDPLVFEDMLLNLRHKNFTLQTQTRNISFQNIPNERARLISHTHKEIVNKHDSCVISVSMSQAYQADDQDTNEIPDATNPFSTDLILIRVSNLLTCPQIRLEQDEYSYLMEGHNIQVSWKDVPINSGNFEEDGMGVVRVCLADFKPDALLVGMAAKEDIPEIILSIICTALSLLCLLLTFITYCLFKSLRSIPGKNNINLTMTLFSAQLLYLVAAGRTEDKGLCEALGIFVHYLWLAVFCAMAVCSFNMFRVFSTVRSREDSSERRRKFLQYCVFIYGLPAILVVLTLVVHIIISEGSFIGYGGNLCYLSSGTAIGIAFGIPVGLTVVVNLVFFILTIRTIRNSPKVVKNKQDEHHVVAYIKLSTLTGITWIIGFFAFGFQWNVLRYLFIVINASQGVFIFVSFVCNRRVVVLFFACCRTQRYLKSQPGTSSVSATKSSASPFTISIHDTKITECRDSTS